MRQHPPPYLKTIELRLCWDKDFLTALSETWVPTKSQLEQIVYIMRAKQDTPRPISTLQMRYEKEYAALKKAIDAMLSPGTSVERLALQFPPELTKGDLRNTIDDLETGTLISSPT